MDQKCAEPRDNGAFVRLNSRWNVLGNRRKTDLDNADRANRALGPRSHSDPWIIHYAGPNKPWSCEGRRITLWNRQFWREAAESAVLPLLVRAYLETCDRRGLTKLQPAAAFCPAASRDCAKATFSHTLKSTDHFTKAAQASESIAQGS